MIADGQIGDPVAERLDDPCGLMAEGHRQGARAIAVDDAEVRVAQARSLDRHQHLAWAGRVEGHGCDRQRTTVGIGMGGAHGAENGGAGRDRHLAAS
jgi:hypothetical protein